MTAHEVVVRFGRRFDVQARDGNGGKPSAFADVAEVTVPFADAESAEAAAGEVSVFVRPVRDAGGEDYRPVVSGEVLSRGPLPG